MGLPIVIIQIIHFNRMFQCEPSIFGYPFMETAHMFNLTVIEDNHLKITITLVPSSQTCRAGKVPIFCRWLFHQKLHLWGIFQLSMFDDTGVTNLKRAHCDGGGSATLAPKKIPKKSATEQSSHPVVSSFWHSRRYSQASPEIGWGTMEPSPIVAIVDWTQGCTNTCEVHCVVVGRRFPWRPGN